MPSRSSKSTPHSETLLVHGRKNEPDPTKTLFKPCPKSDVGPIVNTLAEHGPTSRKARVLWDNPKEPSVCGLGHRAQPTPKEMPMGATNGVISGATAVICLFGLTSLIGGLYTFLRAKYLERTCTATAKGRIADIVDEDFDKKRKRAAKVKSEEDDNVVASNEAIAAKKRAYNAKKRSQAQAQADATVATWRALVEYEVDGHTYQGRAARGVTQGHYKINQPVEVHYDPARPGKVRWYSIDGLPIGMGITLVICGVALFAIGAACWFVLPEVANLS